MKIYVIVYDMFDGDCSYNRIIKAFTNDLDAEEFCSLCKAESQRIHKEIEYHYEIHADELDEINSKVRDIIYANGKLKKPKVLDFSKLPESIRRREIGDAEQEMLKSHKYDPDFRSLEDEYCYNIEEVELD